jgi:serine/threonine protein phosphatase PrpC
MGNFLDTPITDKDTEIGEDEGKGMCYGLSAMQGWRSHMEDDHVQLLSLSPDLPHLSLFGVYDGHGGEMVAHYMAKHFPDHLLATNKLTPDQSKVEAQAKDAFEAALMSIDAELRALPDVESGKDQSGSTAVMTLLSPTHVVCSNTGDSRAVLSRGGEAVALSDDHKPDNAIEKERVMAAGGEVKFGRVNGDLAVSRAVGDFVYKRCETQPPERQAVTAFPEIRAFERDPKDQFVILACDGIWDVMSSQQVVSKVLDLLQNGRPPKPPPPPGDEDPDAEPPPPPREWDLGAVCEALIDHCLELGSRDNMSVIIVLLKPSLKPKPGQEASAAAAN